MDELGVILIVAITLFFGLYISLGTALIFGQLLSLSQLLYVNNRVTKCLRDPRS